MTPVFSLADFQQFEGSQLMRKQDFFPLLSDLSEHSFGISGQNDTFFIIYGSGGNRECYF